jgi:hypothetical protein
MTVQKTSNKPKTQLTIDVLLFVLFTVVVLSKLIEIIIPPFILHFHFMFHVFHAIAGFVMCGVVAYHLYLHWAWIKAQFKRMLTGQP